MGLDTIFSSRQGYELASLLWQGSRMRLRAWTAQLFGNPNQARVCTEFPGQLRLPVLLCKWGEPWAVLSVQVPLYIGLLNGLCSFLCALDRFPGQRD